MTDLPPGATVRGHSWGAGGEIRRLSDPQDAGTRVLAGGRIVSAATCTGETPIWDVLAHENPTFDSAEELAGWVGNFYGYRSTTPTHQGLEMDGVAWWIVDAMTMIHRETVDHHRRVTDDGGRSYFDLVQDCTSISTGEHAALVLFALAAAGFTLQPEGDGGSSHG